PLRERSDQKIGFVFCATMAENTKLEFWTPLTRRPPCLCSNNLHLVVKAESPRPSGFLKFPAHHTGKWDSVSAPELRWAHSSIRHLVFSFKKLCVRRDSVNRIFSGNRLPSRHIFWL
ncbi:mCG1046411, partial [Mus musculus]